jgi:hypothetical protein
MTMNGEKNLPNRGSLDFFFGNSFLIERPFIKKKIEHAAKTSIYMGFWKTILLANRM